MMSHLARSARLLTPLVRTTLPVRAPTLAQAVRLPSAPVVRNTTVLAVRKGDKLVMMADGQVSLGNTVIKANARKIRWIGKNVICGFAGATADALTLYEKLESKLAQYQGQLTRAAVELAKDWRTDKYLRKLEAMMVVGDRHTLLTLTGTGDVLEPTDNVIGIGSGGLYAFAAAKALLPIADLDAEEIAQRAMQIAGEVCVFTNTQFTKEMLVGERNEPDEFVQEAQEPSPRLSSAAAGSQ